MERRIEEQRCKEERVCDGGGQGEGGVVWQERKEEV